MAGKRKRTKLSDLVSLVVVGGVIYAVCRDRVPVAVFALAGASILLFWITLLMPTYCDVQTGQGRGCRRLVNGKLKAQTSGNAACR